MPYISTERVKEIREELKKTFPLIKFSVRREHHSSVYVTILSAPINLLEDTTEKYVQVNVFWIESHYENMPEVRDLLVKIKNIVSAGRHTEVEDGDYGTVPSFYYHIHIGDYDKPFTVVEAIEDGLQTMAEHVAPVAGGIAEIRHNQNQNGIEIKFPDKPADSTLQQIKDSRLFRGSKFNKVWYSKVNTAAIQFAKQFGEIPSTLTV